MDTGRFSYAEVSAEVGGAWHTVGTMPFFLALPTLSGVHRRIPAFYSKLAEAFFKRAERVLADCRAEREAADGRTRAAMREPRMTVHCAVSLPTEENGNRLTVTFSVREWRGTQITNGGTLSQSWDARRGILLPPAKKRKENRGEA